MFSSARRRRAASPVTRPGSAGISKATLLRFVAAATVMIALAVARIGYVAVGAEALLWFWMYVQRGMLL